jgi:hypothetical protein
MRTPKELYTTTPTVYTCELDACPRCGGPLVETHFLSGFKTVQTLPAVLNIAYQPKWCADPGCPGHSTLWASAEWQQIAPRYGTYGYDVIVQIGWQRQTRYQRFADIHHTLQEHVQISESQVRRLYHQVYLPALACQERQHVDRLDVITRDSGLILGLDGLCPEGGEPQLWVVRELQTGLTLRCGWLSMQDEATLVDFLRPIASQGWRVVAVMSDKQRGLVPAVAEVFPDAKHALCQVHYLKNVALPVADADEALKVTLRKQVRDEVGGLIRPEGAADAPGVLTVTGVLPSPVIQPLLGPNEPARPDAERETIVRDILRRVRYVLTLKARPPLRLAGIEMFERLSEIVACLDTLIQHHAEERLVQLRHGLSQVLTALRPDYVVLRQAADWLHQIADLLDPDDKPARSGAEVRRDLWAYLDRIHTESADRPRLRVFCETIRKVSLSYDAGLFHAYDVAGLPRTNNGRESEFRDLTRRLLSTTGQKGLVRRIIQREGAWELIPRPGTLSDTLAAVSHVDTPSLCQEQQRVRNHRNRFRTHIRSAKQSRAQLRQMQQRWIALPGASVP